jgi:dimethylargininase
MGAPTVGLVRRPADTYAAAYIGRGIAIDAERASRQHAAYVAALQAAGISAQTLDGDADYYDCVFVEDTAVVWGNAALIARMANGDRDGEQDAVRAVLSGTHTLYELPADARIDGGDVLHCENVTFVGRSSRTNDSGIDALRRFLEPFGRRVRTVPVQRALHLKTAVTYLGDGVLIAARDLVALDAMPGFEVIATAAGEQGAANCLRVGGDLLIPAGYHATEKLLADFCGRRGLQLHRLEISEFEKGGGGLTCLSLLWTG